MTSMEIKEQIDLIGEMMKSGVIPRCFVVIERGDKETGRMEFTPDCINEMFKNFMDIENIVSKIENSID